MRVVSWNINHWQRREPNRWDIVLNALRRMGAEVALLQEALPPASDGRIALQASTPTVHASAGALRSSRSMTLSRSRGHSYHWAGQSIPVTSR